VDGLPLARAAALVHAHFPQDAEYEFSVFLLRNIVGYMTGLEFAHQLEISIDGERVFARRSAASRQLRSGQEHVGAANASTRAEDAREGQGRAAHGGDHVRQRNHAESDEPLQPHERNHDLQT
jgi:hypothetical protein